MRRVLIATAAILALCVPAFAATAKAPAQPKLAIPSFPGSKSVMEISTTLWAVFPDFFGRASSTTLTCFKP